MDEDLKIDINKVFQEDVRAGLNSTPKKLSSKYFYDATGDALFTSIMHCDEYYPTNCELEIFESQSKQLIDELKIVGGELNVIELGAGDGYKIVHLLKALVNKNIDTIYTPIDISEHAIEVVVKKIEQEIPNVQLNGVSGDYFDMLKDLPGDDGRQKVVMFLGSNIGNMTNENAIAFLSSLAKRLGQNDSLVVGFDLKKNPQTILAAYNDKEGFTAEFNKNLLTRMNRELGANFDLSKFKHSPIYDPERAEARSYLVSTCDQEVYIESIDQTFQFEAWESIHTEISRKYAMSDIRTMAGVAGLKVEKCIIDSRGYYTNAILKLQ